MIKTVTESAIQLNDSFGFTGMLLLIIVALSAVFFTYMFKYLERKDIMHQTQQKEQSDRHEKQQERWIAEFKTLINDSRESNKDMAIAVRENTQAIHKLSTTMEVGFSKLKVNLHD